MADQTFSHWLWVADDGRFYELEISVALYGYSYHSFWVFGVDCQHLLRSGGLVEIIR